MGARKRNCAERTVRLRCSECSVRHRHGARTRGAPRTGGLHDLPRPFLESGFVFERVNLLEREKHLLESGMDSQFCRSNTKSIGAGHRRPFSINSSAFATTKPAPRPMEVCPLGSGRPPTNDENCTKIGRAVRACRFLISSGVAGPPRSRRGVLGASKVPSGRIGRKVVRRLSDFVLKSYLLG